MNHKNKDYHGRIDKHLFQLPTNCLNLAFAYNYPIPKTAHTQIDESLAEIQKATKMQNKLKTHLPAGNNSDIGGDQCKT